MNDRAKLLEESGIENVAEAWKKEWMDVEPNEEM